MPRRCRRRFRAARSTSSFVMRPPGPVPRHARKVDVEFPASRFASGERGRRPRSRDEAADSPRPCARRLRRCARRAGAAHRCEVHVHSLARRRAAGETARHPCAAARRRPVSPSVPRCRAAACRRYRRGDRFARRVDVPDHVAGLHRDANGDAVFDDAGSRRRRRRG